MTTISHAPYMPNLGARSESPHDSGCAQAQDCTCAHSRERVHHGIDCSQCRIRPLSLCSVLNIAELDEFASMGRSGNFAPRQQLVGQGEKMEFVFNVTAGSARLYRLLSDGRRQIVGFVRPGDFIGLSMTERSTFTADALTPVTACRFSRDAFSVYLDERPQLLRRLYEMTGNELSLAQEHMTIIGRRTALERVVCFLIGQRDRWAPVTGQFVHVPLPMTRQDIADYLGLTIETVSRTISKLVRERALVVVPDGVRLLDNVKLAAMAAA